VIAEADVRESVKSTEDPLTSPFGQAQLVGLDRLKRGGRAPAIDLADIDPPRKAQDAGESGVEPHTRGEADLFWSTLALTWTHLRKRLAGAPLPAELDLVREAYSAVNACIGCRACGHECPLKSELPHLKDCFVEAYHQARDPSPADGIVAGFEIAMPWIAVAPSVAREVLETRLTQWLFRVALGVTGLPRIVSRPLPALLRERGVSVVSPAQMSQLPRARLERSVVLVQDVFTSFFEPGVALAAFDLIRVLGYHPLVLQYYPTGRALHIRGYTTHAARVAAREVGALHQVATLGVPLVGLDPAVTLGRNALLDAEPAGDTRVLLLQEWLRERRDAVRGLVAGRVVGPAPPNPYWLLPHCSERELGTGAGDLWQQVFESFGLELRIWAAGCHRSASTGSCMLVGVEDLGDDATPVAHEDGQYLATGYPCRTELSSDTLGRVRHPIEVLGQVASAAPPSS
jgi:Fe-S oxidoreductase